MTLSMDPYLDRVLALSDVTRLRLVALLQWAGRELCVCELVDALEVPQYKVSRSLSELKQSGLVESRQDGKWVSYRVAARRDDFQRHLLAAVAALPSGYFKKDRRELIKRLKRRDNGRCLEGVLKTRLLGRRA